MLFHVERPVLVVFGGPARFPQKVWNASYLVFTLRLFLCACGPSVKHLGNLLFLLVKLQVLPPLCWARRKPAVLGRPSLRWPHVCGMTSLPGGALPQFCSGMVLLS